MMITGTGCLEGASGFLGGENVALFLLVGMGVY